MEANETPAPVYPLAALLGELESDAAKRAESYAAGTARGPLTGLPSLDRLTGGCLEPGLHVLHGNAGTGKTAFALNIAARCGCPSVFVSAEMGRLELLRRLMARETGTYLGKLKSGELSPGTMRDLAIKTARAAPLLALMDATTAPAPAEHITATARRLRDDSEEARQAPGLLIVVDSAHAWSSALSDLRGVDEYERLNETIERLRLMAASLGAAVLMIAERTKASSAGGMNAGAGTRGFAYKAETVLELDRADDKDPRPGPYTVVLRVTKNRHGSCGRVDLTFDGALMKHTENGPAEPPPLPSIPVRPQRTAARR